MLSILYPVGIAYDIAVLALSVYPVQHRHAEHTGRYDILEHISRAN